MARLGNARRFLRMLKRKGASQILWFVLAFIIILILIVIALMILSQGQEHALGGIEDIFGRIGDMV